ncbi:MAG: heavy-metal-associated domain-containing protein [Catenulispora sp.]|nr:heavy-metal-associated domain-containing protein [Catenulispora sp.]NUR61013.1 heavy-metal-associated domain-containing protein [Catenulispora sp.]
MTELTLVPAEEAAGGCACCAAPTDDTTASKENPVTGSTTDHTVTVYTVSGMTCGHCVKSVTEEVSAIAGVSAVEVELATGQVTVTSSARLAEADVKAAVDEAGYQLVA